MPYKKLKIIIFDGSFKTTPFINRLAEGLAAKHTVYIMGFNERLSHKIDKVEYVPLGSNDSKVGFALTTLKWLFMMGNIALLFPTLKNLFTGQRGILQKQNLKLALKNINPDIIHLQWPSVISTFEEILMEQKIPVVLSQRGYHNNVRPFVDTTNYQYLNKWYPKIAGFHSVSKAISKEGDKIYNSSAKIDRVVYTGLDLEHISFSKNCIKSQKLEILSVGRPHWKKGYSYAIRACKILKDNNVPFHYTIIGASEHEELAFLLNDLNLSQSVTLQGKIKQNMVYEAMRNASLLLLPSVEEGIANVVIEAMAIGLPVISTNCGGMEEAIEDSAEGWIVPIRNSEAIANAIINFNTISENKIETIRLNARKKVINQFSKEIMINAMVELYKEIDFKNLNDEFQH